MPGLTLTMTSCPGSRDHSDLSKAQGLLIHNVRYRPNIEASSPGLHLGWVAYDEYPVRVFSTPGCRIYLEGRIYNKAPAAIEAELAILPAQALAPRFDEAAIQRFLLSNEGSYIVAIVRPETREFLVFTDPFGRLPLYYSADESRVVVSREAKFVHAVSSDPGFDPVGCAQLLAFGLPLRDRTVLKGVKIFPDAGLLHAEVSDGRIRWRLRKLHAWNLDDEDGSRSASSQAAQFADLFVDACRNWGSHAGSRGNLVSLSGGHDSRAVAAGLVRSGCPVIAVTYRDPNGTREDEVRYAQQATEALGLEWRCIDLRPATQSAYEELVWLKDGMNWASMAFILSYLTDLVCRWGPDWTYLSGDGGDDCLKVTAPRRHFRNVEDVIQYVLDKETCVPPDLAEAMLRLPTGTLRAELRSMFESYPERDLARLVKHYKIFERGRRCYFEGEDRTRFFLWQDSPFYSLKVFRHCMRVPDRQKYYKVFCRQAMQSLSPVAAGVPVASSGYPPASWKYIIYHRAREFVLELPGPLTAMARGLTWNRRSVRHAVPGELTKYLHEELAKNTPLKTLLDSRHVRRALQNIFDAHSFFCLWTVVMLEKVYRQRVGQSDDDMRD